MPKYHISPTTGNPNQCRAQAGRCPFGSPEEHYTSKEDAREAYEAKQGALPASTTRLKASEALLTQVETAGYYGDNFRKLSLEKPLTKQEQETLSLYARLGRELAKTGPTEDTRRAISALHFAKEQLSPRELLMLADMEAQVKAPHKRIKVYHGSAERFESFSYGAIGKNGTSEGQGFYFTNSKKVAANYGEDGFMYEVDFIGRKGLGHKEVTLTRSQFRELLEAVHEETNHLEDWGDVDHEGKEVVLLRALDAEYYTGPGANDVDNVGGLINAADGSAETVYRLLYERYGYDHIPAKVDWGTKGQTVYVATVPEAFQVFAVRPIQEDDFAEGEELS